MSKQGESNEVHEQQQWVSQPVFCGNTWDVLGEELGGMQSEHASTNGPAEGMGSEKSRPCQACDRRVYNLARLSPEEIESAQRENPERLCVVYEPGNGWIDWTDRQLAVWQGLARLFPLKQIAVLLPALLLLQSTVFAQQQADLAEKLKPCHGYLFVPMAMPAGDCIDGKGESVRTQDWLRAEWMWRQQQKKGSSFHEFHDQTLHLIKQK